MFSKGIFYLVTHALSVGGVWWLVPYEHVIEIKPREGENWTRMVREMGDKAFLRGFSDVKNKKLFGTFLIFSI